jgi:hypothetical protein
LAQDSEAARAGEATNTEPVINGVTDNSKRVASLKLIFMGASFDCKSFLRQSFFSQSQ